MKKPKKAKKPMKTILRIGLPMFLAAITLWSCAMVQITTSAAQGMVDRLPQQNAEFAHNFASFIVRVATYNSGNDQYFGYSSDPCSRYFHSSFPSFVHPFLLDLTKYEDLPSELRYGYKVGAALFTDEGETLFATGDLITANQSVWNIPSYFEPSIGVPYLKEQMTVDDPFTNFWGASYPRIGLALGDISNLMYISDDRDTLNHLEYLPFIEYSYCIYREKINTNYFAYVEDNTVLYYSTIVTCRPLTYCKLRLIPFYCVTFLVTTLITSMCLLIVKFKLLDPLHEQAEAMEKLLPDMTQKEWDTIRRNGFRWEEPMVARSHVIRLQKIKAEMTRMETALDYARDAEENRKQLISNITHELKTPLAVIHSYAEGLQSGIAAEKKEHYVEVILDEADRMDAMVLQMLELSRLEAGRVKITLDSFSFSELLQYVAEKFQPLLDAKNLTLQLSLAELLTIHASESRLEQVLTNYLSNAVRYTPCGGQIVIRAACNQKELFFDITNTAPHLSEEGLEKVYDSFYREETSRSTKSTGLGLAIVKGIISLHGGECYVSNTELDGKSAVHFGFRIPK